LGGGTEHYAEAKAHDDDDQSGGDLFHAH